MKLFHVSDVHFGAEDPAALDWFARCVRDEAPDAVVMTGDLTMRARASEFAAGAAWLKSLAVPVTVEIGNHDIPYYSDPLRRLFQPYRRYAAIERMIEHPLHLDGVSIVPLKTIARAQLRWDWSKGRVGPRALRHALALVAEAPGDNLIFVAAHHPLIEGGTVGTARTRHGAGALRALAAAGADAILSGHVHDPFDVSVERAGRTIRMIGAGTLSRRTRHSPPAFNEIRVADGDFVTLSRTLSQAPVEVVGAPPAPAGGDQAPPR